MVVAVGLDDCLLVADAGGGGGGGDWAGAEPVPVHILHSAIQSTEPIASNSCSVDASFLFVSGFGVAVSVTD